MFFPFILCLVYYSAESAEVELYIHSYINNIWFSVYHVLFIQTVYVFIVEFVLTMRTIILEYEMEIGLLGLKFECVYVNIIFTLYVRV